MTMRPKTIFNHFDDNPPPTLSQKAASSEDLSLPLSFSVAQRRGGQAQLARVPGRGRTFIMYPDGEGDGVKVARTSTSLAKLVVLWRTVFGNCFPCKIYQ